MSERYLLNLAPPSRPPLSCASTCIHPNAPTTNRKQSLSQPQQKFCRLRRQLSWILAFGVHKCSCVS